MENNQSPTTKKLAELEKTWNSLSIDEKEELLKKVKTRRQNYSIQSPWAAIANSQLNQKACPCCHCRRY
jgi:hypothetical protein